MHCIHLVLMGGVCAHWWAHIFSTSDCESGKETVPLQLPFSFSLAPLMADQTAGGPLRAFFREAYAHSSPNLRVSAPEVVSK